MKVSSDSQTVSKATALETPARAFTLRRFLFLSLLCMTGSLFGQVTYSGSFPEGAEITAERQPASGGGYAISEVAVSGDPAIVYGLSNWPTWEREITAGGLTKQRLDEITGEILAALQEAGYIFTTLSYRENLLSQGLLVLRVQTGEMGNVTVSGNEHYKAEQILDMVEWKSGDNFNYNQTFQNLYGVNSRNYLEVQTEFKPRETGSGERIVDLDLQVKDRVPFSVNWKLSNDGNRSTGDWRSRLGVQFENLLKRNGTFTSQWLTSPEDIGNVNAVSLAYTLPVFENMQFSIYGTYSESNINNVLPQIDVFGEGTMLGTSLIFDLWETDAYKVTAAASWLYIQADNTTVFGGEAFPINTSDVNLSMPNLSVSYIGKEFDSFGGKSFATFTILGNYNGFAGASVSDEALDEDVDAYGDFIIFKFDASRLQKLDRFADGWSMFLNFNSQLAGDEIPAQVQKTLGGLHSVRGYEERGVRGDYGYNFTAELRTPVFTNFIYDLKKPEDYLLQNPGYLGQHRLQFVAFFDAGAVVLHDPDPGQERDHHLYSAGLGARFMLSPYARFSVDVGFPFESVPESDNSAHAHMALEVSY